jgi:hypothetical protein
MNQKERLLEKLDEIRIPYNEVKSRTIEAKACLRHFVKVDFINEDQVKMKSIIKGNILFSLIRGSYTFSFYLYVFIFLIYFFYFEAYFFLYCASKYPTINVIYYVAFTVLGFIEIFRIIYVATRLRSMKKRIVAWLNS